MKKLILALLLLPSSLFAQLNCSGGTFGCSPSMVMAADGVTINRAGFGAAPTTTSTLILAPTGTQSQSTNVIKITDAGNAVTGFSLLSNVGVVETIMGTDSSVGGQLGTGTAAFASVFGSAGSNVVNIIANNALRWTVGTTGALTAASGSTLNSTTINDSAGGPFLLSSATASAADSFTVTSAASATLPTVTFGASGSDSNVTTQISGKGTGLVSTGSIMQAPSNIVRLDSPFTDGSGTTALQAITGLNWTMPANIATIWPFHCRLVVNQNVAAVVDTIGIQDVTVAPTYIQATGAAETALTAAAFGDLGTGLTTTTATSIISFTPGASGTNLTVLIDGIIKQPSNASSSVIQMMASQATAANTIIFQTGSFCSFGGTS